MAFDPTGGQLDEGQLNMGYWWVTHQVQVRKAATVVFGIFACSLFAYAAWGLIDWAFVSGVKERELMGQVVDQQIPIATFRKYGMKEEPVFDRPTILAAGEGRYDLFAKASNANANWMLTFDYRFEAAGTTIPAKQGFLLPGETKRLHALAVRADAKPSTAETVVTNLRWHRVDPHLVYPGYREWATKRLDLAIEKPTFTPPAPGDALPVSHASFAVVNRTAFSYRTVGFFVTLYAGQQPVGVNYFSISGLSSGERRQVDVAWYSALPQITRVEVMPEVNILDASVYLQPR
jgi:hypothetical protein